MTPEPQSRSVVTVEFDPEAIKIKFGGVLHLWLDRPTLVGVQSWQTGERRYAIKYYFRGADPVLSEYDDVDKWREILSRLDEVVKTNPIVSKPEVLMQDETPATPFRVNMAMIADYKPYIPELSDERRHEVAKLLTRLELEMTTSSVDGNPCNTMSLFDAVLLIRHLETNNFRLVYDAQL